MSHSSDGKTIEAVIKTEVLFKPQRRQFSTESKRRILQEYEACSTSGEKGALLRREAHHHPLATLKAGPGAANANEAN